MNGTEKKGSELLHSAALIGFTALLMLLFASSLFMHHFLPKVDVEAVGSGTLSAAIRGSGVAVTEGSTEITSPASRVVENVFIRPGQSVKKGELLISFEQTFDSEISEEYEKLDQLMDEYESYARQTPLLTDFTNPFLNVNGTMVNFDKLEVMVNDAMYSGRQEEYNELKALRDQTRYQIDMTKYYENAGIDATNASLLSMEEKIAEQQKLLREMSGVEGENGIYAVSDCTVSSVSCKNGETVDKGDTLCVLGGTQGRCTLSFVVTKEQAECVKVGDRAAVGSGYFDSGVNAELKSMHKVDNGVKLTFALSGSVSDGDELTLLIGRESADFDLVVPISAVHSDSNGSYVMTVEPLSGRLGKQYAARRTGVEVLAQDDSRCAVIGDIHSGDWLIINSETPIADGDQVEFGREQ